MCHHNGFGVNDCSHSEDAGVECRRTAFKLRLQGPLIESGIGRVEVLYNGQWGTICDDDWDINDAKVVCRELGYPGALNALQGTRVQSGSGHILLDSVSCTGTEESLAHCSHQGWKNHDCSHSEDAGVQCMTTAIEVTGNLSQTLRLEGPLSANGTGRVEVLYQGLWGTICDAGWGIEDARVVCRQLGYPDAVRHIVGGQDIRSRRLGPIWLSNVACTGQEQNLTSCPHDGWGNNACPYYRDAGVECSRTVLADKPLSLRLKGPLSATGTGRVEVLYNGQWGTICDHGWDLRDAKVACRQLGYPYAFNILRGGEVPSGSGRIWLTNVACNGDEQNITSCFHYGWGYHECDHNRDAGVMCTRTEPNLPIRLQGPLNATGIGRVEVLHDGEWGTICDDRWGFDDARVVCRQLGFSDAVSELPAGGVPPGSGRIWLDEVACTGEEGNIAMCFHNGYGNEDCTHSEDAGVICRSTGTWNQSEALRLQGPLSANGTGRVEVFYRGQWGTVCDNGWDFEDAVVACRQLGYAAAIRSISGREVLPGTGPVMLSLVACKGQEEKITSCAHNGWGNNACSHSEDAGVECSKTVVTEPVKVRLQGPLDVYGIGRVEVFYNGQWGTICDDAWDMNAAKVVCRQLGYSSAFRYLQGGQVSSGTGPILLDDVSCNGTEQNLASCSHRGWGNHDCTHSEDAGVECLIEADADNISQTLRLKGPLSANGTGRVEVFHNRLWGTICDDAWDIKDARVVCRQLGYPDAVRSLGAGQVPPGFHGNIWLSHVNCTGREQNLTRCSYTGWGNTGCSHSEDAGVECSTTVLEGKPVPLRLQGPLSENGTGRVEVLYNGQWGTICDAGWDLRDAKVACRQLGYSHAFNALQGRDVRSGSGQIWLANVDCSGNEKNITSCTHSGWKKHSCEHTQDAGVECTTEEPNLPVRLQGPLSANGTGRVEVFHDGQWGTVCDDDWDMDDAKVVCRQLGFSYALSRYVAGDVPSGTGPTWLDNVACTGEEKNIAMCYHNGLGNEDCTHSEDAGVECSNTDYSSKDGSLRLQGDLSASGIGRVEILYAGRWGTICDDEWDINDANVACRQLGYPGAVRSIEGLDVPDGVGPILLDDVSCKGTEQNLTSCSHRRWGKHDCSHPEDAGVECTTTDTWNQSQALRLQGPLSANGTGRVEVFYRGQWGTICDGGWDFKDAIVACRQLGYAFAVRSIPGGEVPPGTGPVMLSNVRCTGQEQNIRSCPHNGWANNDCPHSNDAGVECGTTGVAGEPGSLRLQGPLSATGIGRVEVLYNGQWGAVCNRGWQIGNSKVVCRQLGYSGVIRTLSRDEVPSGDGPIWLSNLHCTGEEQNITGCDHSGWGDYNCEGYENFGVECQTTVYVGRPGSLRLQGPSSANGTGRVEVLYNGQWGTICDDNWDMRDAKVACRQLGFPDAHRPLRGGQIRPGSGRIFLDEVSCTGTEQNISSCSHSGWGISDCSHNEDAGVECSRTVIDVTGNLSQILRLQGPLSANGTGRVEIFYNGKWGTICQDGWDIKDARVACRQLGYPDAVRSLGGGYVPSGTGNIWLTQVSCTGNEQSITSCYHDGYGNNICSHSEDAGVECNTEVIAGRPVSVRLRGPLSANGTGRVEVLYNGQWGTICDDGWDINDARVACRQLGYPDAIKSLRGGEVPFGSGPIWLSYVNCIGQEPNITSCSNNAWGNNACSHSEDAGVECSTTEIGPVKIRLRGPLSRLGKGRVEVLFQGQWGTICRDEWDSRDAAIVCRQLGYPDALRTLIQVPPGSGPIWLDGLYCKRKETDITRCSHAGWGVHDCSHSEDVGVECKTAGDYDELELK
ncbi:deleted in malignant brain tumors 1 protein-like isoform X2 [Dendronephthya gigantea]|uniref:deleted in malignant brain tumors 1 protein-like isoform X2 n=1 Tax=Dendronephthya gigantea TaxID=151771 RepID=UPI00106D0808|nr:deleted in malignant brain tumors 1 protein-like isoform X2 [Dendronephthya gigantea]